MGRRADPGALQQAKGNPGRRPIAPELPVVDVLESAGSAPAWLTAEAAEIWQRLAPDLASMNLLKRPDELTFGRYCANFALWLKAAAALGVGDLVVTTESEHVTMDRLNKNLQAMLLLEKRLVDMEDRFGLNPLNRQRIFAQRAAGSALPGELFGDEPLGRAGDAPVTGFLQ